MFSGEDVWFQGHRVPSDAGGDANGCIFPGCTVEVWACCPFCRECLCGHHLDSPCPHSSQGRRDLWATVIEDGMPSGPRPVSPCTPAAWPTRSPSPPSAAPVSMPRRRLRRKTPRLTRHSALSSPSQHRPSSWAGGASVCLRFVQTAARHYGFSRAARAGMLTNKTPLCGRVRIVDASRCPAVLLLVSTSARRTPLL